MKRLCSPCWVGAVVALALVMGGCGRGNKAEKASPGITGNEIKLGDSIAFSGPASAYGTLARAEKAYFDVVNSKGGVNGRKIKFIALDDAYQPQRTLENARRLIEKEKVFALFNTAGTADNLAIWDYVNQQKVPQAFVASGAAEWGADIKKHPFTIGWAPDYITEGKLYADYVSKEKPGAKVGALYQNDSYGKELLSGFQKGISGKNVKVVAKQSYEVTDPSVSSQISKLANSGANVFLDITTPKFSTQAIKRVAEIGWKPLHVLNSVSSYKSPVLEPAGLKNSQGIVSATIYKDPESPQFANDPAVKDYKAGLEKYAPRANPNDPLNVSGWAQAETIVKALEQMKEPTRAALMAAIRNLDVEIPTLLPGIRIKTSPTDGYPIQAFQLERFEGKYWKLLGNVIQLGD